MFPTYCLHIDIENDHSEKNMNIRHHTEMCLGLTLCSAVIVIILFHFLQGPYCKAKYFKFD